MKTVNNNKMKTELIAFRVPSNIKQIMLEGMKKRKIEEQTEYIKSAILEYAGYKYIPAQVIKNKNLK